MTLDVSSLLPYGPLTPLEVYFEHEGPKFFALQSAALGLRVIAICIDDGDDEPGVLTFLYLPVSRDSFVEIRAGHTTLWEAFASSGQVIWRIREDYNGADPIASVERVAFEDLDEGDLPFREAKLELPTPTALPLRHGELIDRAAGTGRMIGVIELEAEDETVTEFPLRGLGRVSVGVQDTFDSLAHETAQRPNARGAVASELAADVQFSVLGLRAASFAIMLGSSPRQELLVNPRLHAVLDDMFDLLAGASDEALVVEKLYQHDRRVRSRFVGLLGSVRDFGSGIGFITVEPDGDARETHLSRDQVTRALEAVSQVSQERLGIEVPRAMLTASNTSRHTFELIDAATGARYAGKVDPAAHGQIEGLKVGHSSFVSATMVADVEFVAEDEETGRTVTLLAIRARG